jgi:hypothetical protein
MKKLLVEPERFKSLIEEYKLNSNRILIYNNELNKDDRKRCAICIYSVKSVCPQKGCKDFSGFIKKPNIEIESFKVFLRRFVKKELEKLEYEENQPHTIEITLPKWLSFLIKK